MVAIRRLFLEGAVIERETAVLKVEKRYKVMNKEVAFTWLLVCVPDTMLAWKGEHESEYETWDTFIASMLVAEQKSGEKQGYVFALRDDLVPDDPSYALLAYAQSNVRADKE